jgi:Holliday junction resolvasome RuvABC DNA-binding subunit
MITFLHGKLIESLPTHVILDVNGVGYEALIRFHRSTSCRSRDTT